jgi:hypothetical protein
MTPTVVLFVLRLLSALLLLGFLSVLVWFIYQDLRAVATAVAAQDRIQGRLRVVASTGGKLAVDTLYPVLPVTSIGRANSNTIVLDDGYVSGEHVLLTLRGGNWWAQDLGSRNGTLLNALPLAEPTVVSTGDLLTIGNTQLRLELGRNAGSTE